MDILSSIGAFLKTVTGILAFWRPKPGPDVPKIPVPPKKPAV